MLHGECALIRHCLASIAAHVQWNHHLLVIRLLRSEHIQVPLLSRLCEDAHRHGDLAHRVVRRGRRRRRRRPVAQLLLSLVVAQHLLQPLDVARSEDLPHLRVIFLEHGHVARVLPDGLDEPRRVSRRPVLRERQVLRRLPDLLVLPQQRLKPLDVQRLRLEQSRQLRPLLAHPAHPRLVRPQPPRERVRVDRRAAAVQRQRVRREQRRE
mmetsp:Transcript_23689/g.41743  ORF Transcript_23689/g.41743 Transcript_23689/m.41743 type:complete len:210 (-) Transcript_23689:33-662(-)